MKTVRQAGAQLDQAGLSARDLALQAFSSIRAPDGEGARAFVRVYNDSALAAAQQTDDDLRTAGKRRSPLAGIPVSIKDLFDVAGGRTYAGSRVLAQTPRAEEDAIVVQRLRASGAVIMGRTNMTEFAYSGLGINSHYGTPLNPYRRHEARIPGGSSSGAAVSVSDGMALGAVATDTGGSARIPAAFCGLTGFKPTASRIPLAGAYPLSPSLDSVGSIGATVECCALLDAVMAGIAWQAPRQSSDGASLRLGMVMNYVMDDLDPQVAKAYENAMATLSHNGVRIEPVHFPELQELPEINRQGGFPAYESYRHQAGLVASHAHEYDPRVLSRILRGQAMSDTDYMRLRKQRSDLIARTHSRFEGFDALISPTVPIVAPLLADCEDDDNYSRLNLLTLRNPSIVNFLDGCALSLPCHEPGLAPVGLMLFQQGGFDHQLLTVAYIVERILHFHKPPADAR
ncbi:MAG: amidase [Pseudomonadota bacterium]